MYDKTIIRFGFCDILNSQGLGKCYQPRPSARLITLTSILIIQDITKTSSNNFLLLCSCFERDSRDPPRNSCTQPLEASDCPLGSLRSITQIPIACHVHAVDQFLFFY